MSAILLALVWCVIGAAVELAWPGESEGYEPWYLTPLCIISRPLLLAPQFLPLAVAIETLSEEGDDE